MNSLIPIINFLWAVVGAVYIANFALTVLFDLRTPDPRRFIRLRVTVWTLLAFSVNIILSVGIIMLTKIHGGASEKLVWCGAFAYIPAMVSLSIAMVHTKKGPRSLLSFIHRPMQGFWYHYGERIVFPWRRELRSLHEKNEELRYSLFQVHQKMSTRSS